MGPFTWDVCPGTLPLLLDWTTGYQAELSTSGGTSDGRFIAPTGAQVIELGPRNETIHRVDEAIDVGDIALLSDIYRRTLERLLSGPG